MRPGHAGVTCAATRAENPAGCESGEVEPAGLIPSPVTRAGPKLVKGTMQLLTIMAAIFFQASGPASLLGNPLVMMVVVMAIFYVMLILPQQRQRKKLQEMLGALKAGDKVITNGGIYGTINGLDGDTVILKIADQVKIRIARSAITQVETPEDAK